MVRSEEMHEKTHKGVFANEFMCERVSFRKLTDWHFATLLRINFFTDNFQGF